MPGERFRLKAGQLNRAFHHDGHGAPGEPLRADLAVPTYRTEHRTQILWNFTSSGQAIALGNGASSFPLPDAFHGVILAPNDTIRINNSNLDGRVFGGDGQIMQIETGGNYSSVPESVPECSTLTLMGSVLTGAGILCRRLRNWWKL